MKALTLWQPWATLVVYEVKPFEFRKYPAPKWIVGERIAIHAGARPVRPAEIADLIASLRLEQGWGTALQPGALDLLLTMQANPERIPVSSVLGTARVGQPVEAGEIVREAYAKGFKGDSDRVDHQVWGWPMEEVERFDVPVPAKGAQGFWSWGP